MAINALEFDEIAREVFAPIYPVIAAQIIDRTGITSGCCLDIGCGGGYLGLALARISTMEMILFDESADMLDLAKGYIHESGLKARAKTLQGDVHSIPLPDNSVNLAISRGSMFFWEDQVQAFREIYRVLAPGGMTCIGGGFGNQELLKKVEKEMLKRDPQWGKKRQQRVGKDKVADYKAKLEQADISRFEIQQDEAGLWIMISKTA
ncbi:Methyltransferase type 11 [Syntrophomonas zehnderi OL-4]|uniref:Methyltransferase type 11 n=1 Tax=Syntrophomonas zehnderi OL-4 TaxID=690567 RepID=A0A0E4GBV9_9FIRM|nr:class I SAM-dependent methyltransferase [Syntrophomonas zehnderi]CFX84241.1 Methyltransferase type 11 [Syntrophomonas zehnderi OL-4]